MKQLVFFLILFKALHSQGVTIGSNNPPDASAALDVQSSTGGIANPRLTTAQRNAIVSPLPGLQVYNIDTDCFEMYFLTGGWKAIQCGCSAFPNAVFNVPNGFVGSAVSFAISTPGMFSYSWTFSGGSPSSASGSSPSVTWNASGTFSLNLTLTDSAGCSSTYSDSITISSCQPFTQTFTPCGATGKNGPSQTQCNNSYGSALVSLSSGIQEWTVPVSGVYRIVAAGASGGAGGTGTQGGRGAVVGGNFQLNAGTTLRMLIGQSGTSVPDGGGGGGGSFVVNAQSVPFIIAGGGGGGNGNTSSTRGFYNGGDGVLGTTGGSSNITSGSYGQAAPGTGGGTIATGGTNGFGGGGAVAGGGGGLLNSGGTGSSSSAGTGFAQGGAGGDGSSSNQGGFGGGAGGVVSSGYGGGGGGYSGGGGGNWNGTNHGNGGGGASFLESSALQVATSTGQFNGSASFNGSIQNLGIYNSGHGYITITRVCQ
jgi:hypothetical protein